ncbi:MAG: MBL fold metallo-hydrolase [Myxococcales bacterium]|nr:MBL fold metallo-hydrolase [Myxococcales bacterium]
MILKNQSTHHAAARTVLMVALALSLPACANRTIEVRSGDQVVHTLRLSYNNAHLLVHNGNAVLIDAGLQADAAKLDAEIRGVGVDPAKLRAIIITHGHADHAGGAGWFKQRYKTPILAGAGDKKLLLSGHNDKLCPTDSQARGRLDEDQNATYKPFPADTWVTAPIDLMTVAGIRGQILPMAGHTAGSLVVVSGDAAFVGDLFRGEIVGSGPTTHFYMCDLKDNRADIRGLYQGAAAKAKTYFVGHFGPVTREDVGAWIASWQAESAK